MFVTSYPTMKTTRWHPPLTACKYSPDMHRQIVPLVQGELVRLFDLFYMYMLGINETSTGKGGTWLLECIYPFDIRLF